MHEVGELEIIVDVPHVEGRLVHCRGRRQSQRGTRLVYSA
jgi:hypothetical protein